MRTRVLQFFIFAGIVIILMVILALMIDERISRQQRKWEKSTPEFEQIEPEGMAIARPSDGD